MTHISPQSLRTYAIVAGICFILLLISGPLGLLYMPEQIFTPDNATQTAQNLMEQSALFFMGIGALVVIFVVEIVLCCLLYVLMRPAGPALALMALAARLSMTVVIGMIIVPLLVAHHVVTAGTYAELATGELALTLYQTNLSGTVIWQFAFALHLVLLGTLVFRSTYLPRLLGVALFIGGFGYATDSIGRMLGLMDMSAYSLVSNSLLAAGGVGEIGLGLWLLIKGVHKDKWQAKALAA